MIDPSAAPAGDAGEELVPVVSDDELGPVARTLLITLWARAAESRRPDALRHDPDAARLLSRIEHDFARYERGLGGGWKTQVGVAVRGRRIDDAVRDFCVEHPDGLIIELGAGLDGRSRRLGGPENDWLLVDLPDVMAVRRRLLPPTETEHLHAGSLTDPGWIDATRRLGDRPRLIIAEGVLMFVARASVASFLATIAERLPGTRVVADAIGGLMVRFPWLHDTLPSSGVRFAWGLKHGREPETWHPGVRVDRVHPLILDGGARWRWMRFLRPVPVMRRQFVLLELTCSSRRHGPGGLPTPRRPSA